MRWPITLTATAASLTTGWARSPALAQCPCRRPIWHGSISRAPGRSGPSLPAGSSKVPESPPTTAAPLAPEAKTSCGLISPPSAPVSSRRWDGCKRHSATCNEAAWRDLFGALPCGVAVGAVADLGPSARHLAAAGQYAAASFGLALAAAARIPAAPYRAAADLSAPASAARGAHCLVRTAHSGRKSCPPDDRLSGKRTAQDLSHRAWLCARW